MSIIDEILFQKNLKYEELTREERAKLHEMANMYEQSQLSIDDIRLVIRSMRVGLEKELNTIKDAPEKWISLLSLFLPFYGIITKWYQDRKDLFLKARIVNYSMLEEILSGPERAKRAIERDLKLNNTQL